MWQFLKKYISKKQRCDGELFLGRPNIIKKICFRKICIYQNCKKFLLFTNRIFDQGKVERNTTYNLFYMQFCTNETPKFSPSCTICLCAKPNKQIPRRSKKMFLIVPKYLFKKDQEHLQVYK